MSRAAGRWDDVSADERLAGYIAGELTTTCSFTRNGDALAVARWWRDANAGIETVALGLVRYAQNAERSGDHEAERAGREAAAALVALTAPITAPPTSTGSAP